MRHSLSAILTTLKTAIVVDLKWRNTNVDVALAIVRVAVIVALLVMLQSCSARYHLRRALKKDASIASDTIVQIDTTILTQEKILVDTLVIQDTIVREIRSDGVIVKLQRIHDTILVDALCESDTIKIMKEVEVVRYIEEQKTSIFDKMNVLIRSLIALIASVTAFFVVKRMFKN